MFQFEAEPRNPDPEALDLVQTEVCLNFPKAKHSMGLARAGPFFAVESFDNTLGDLHTLLVTTRDTGDHRWVAYIIWL